MTGTFVVPATSFLLDGDTALLVSPPPWSYMSLDRPCDTCGGGGRLRENAADPHGRPCPDCIDGRYTFEIEVGRSVSTALNANPQTDGWAIDTLTVHVIDVLPIVDEDADIPDTDYIVVFSEGDAEWWSVDPDLSNGWLFVPITLPPDAAPGKWLVRLKVH